MILIAFIFLQVNYNLMTVNIAMATTGLYQLYRKVEHDVVKQPTIPESDSSQPSVKGTTVAQ